MMTCAKAADHGGESFAVDGRLLQDILASEDPHALRALSRPRSALFGGGGGHLGAVFETSGDGRVSIRLRLDELARYSPDVERVLPRLGAGLAAATWCPRRGAGQGYVSTTPAGCMAGRFHRPTCHASLARRSGGRTGYPARVRATAGASGNAIAMTTSETGDGQQVTMLTCLAAELGGRDDGWVLTLAPARGRPVLEVVSLATRRQHPGPGGGARPGRPLTAARRPAATARRPVSGRCRAAPPPRSTGSARGCSCGCR